MAGSSNTPVAPAPGASIEGVPAKVKRAALDLAATCSIEMGAHRPEDAVRIAALLPAGTLVYVNHLPRHSLEDTMRGLLAVKAAGLEAVPHIAARRVTSRTELKSFVERAVGEAGIKKALILGGDLPTPNGPYSDAISIMRDGVLAESGLKELGFAGYPEGHAHIPLSVLTQGLADKVALAKAQGLGSYVVTQFSFAPNRVVEYCAGLGRRMPDVPVYVGLAGPTNPAKLLRYAQVCGVSASFRALQAAGMGAVRLFTHTDPTEQLITVASHTTSGAATANVVGIHMFTFGGIDTAAAWINMQIAKA
jgi:methylenetetrahydrofolate reductase (NADPH)